jgi:hypothetical protein
MKAPGKLPVLRKFSRGLYYIYYTGTLYGKWKSDIIMPVNGINHLFKMEGIAFYGSFERKDRKGYEKYG